MKKFDVVVIVGTRLLWGPEFGVRCALCLFMLVDGRQGEALESRLLGVVVVGIRCR